MNETGGINIDRISELLSIPIEQVIEKSRGVLFKNPVTLKYETKDKYLSGNVKEKLLAAELAAKNDKEYESNVTHLREVQPEDISASRIYAPISAGWMPTEIISEFLSEIFSAEIEVNRLSNGVSISKKNLPEVIQKTYGTQSKSALDIAQEAILNRLPRVTRTVEGKTYVDEKETAEAIEKWNRMKAEFDKWLLLSDDRRDKIEVLYNDKFNNSRERKYDGSHLTFEGYALPYQPRQHQKDAVWLILQQMNGIIDHIVGAGKTLIMVTAAMKLKQMGLVKKPMIIGLKANTDALASEFIRAYPMAKVLYPNSTDLTPKSRKNFLAKIANNDWDIIIMTHEQFGKIPQSHEVEYETIQEEVKALEIDLADRNLSKRERKGLEERKSNLMAKLSSLSQSMAKDSSPVDFQTMGIDFLFVDESQQFKNLSYSTKQRGVAGLGSPKGSQKAFNLLIAARTLQKRYS